MGVLTRRDGGENAEKTPPTIKPATHDSREGLWPDDRQPPALVINRLCKKCHSDLSIIMTREESAIWQSEPEILGAAKCKCNGRLFVRIDPKLRGIFGVTLLRNGINLKNRVLFEKIFFAPVSDSKLATLELHAACSCTSECSCTKRLVGSIRIHSHFEESFSDRLTYSSFAGERFNPDEAKKILNLLFG